MRTLLIDANNIFICCYSVNSTCDNNGNPTGGIVGSLKYIENIVRIIKPQRVICVFDGEGGSQRRRNILKEYKEGRKPIIGRKYSFGNESDAKRNLSWQIKTFQDLLSYLPFCQIQISKCEADDIISYLVKYAEYFGHTSSIIVSTDKDYYQLLENKVAIYNPIQKKLITQASLVKETSIHPENWLLYKCFMGDKSDNIKGVLGVGEVYFKKLFPNCHEPLSLEPKDIKSVVEQYKIKTGKVDKTADKVYNSIPLLEENWKLMDLKNPMMSSQAKDQVTYKIKEFKPALNTKELYSMLFDGRAYLSNSMINSMSYLSNVANHKRP